MLRFFENLVDPYQLYQQTDTPPRRLWPFLRDYVRPFKAVFWATGIFALLNAVFDTALIWYVGQVVDYLGTGTPAEVWATYGTEIIWVAIAI
ncbi:MAG: multidrug ABC transporter ATP-binding protein, partial [Tabrizicola sp.]|nr:multidrug ABC transporter ATP-binding protein [Tabrizicola sp.]